jgi:tol-pal system protein YbgF
MRRLAAIVGAVLLCGACARPGAAPPPQAPEDPVSRLRQDNAALRRKLQMLEDRVLRLERRGSASEPEARADADAEVERELPVVRLERKQPAREEPVATEARSDPRRSKRLASPQPAPAQQLWDEDADAGQAGATPESAEGGGRTDAEGRSFRLVGTELIEATKAKAPRRPDQPARDERGKAIIAEYETAMALYKAGELGGAERAFELFARAHPKHDYADNAIYWRGESAYDQGHYADALAAFTEVIERYGGGNKAADALLKIGLCYGKLGDRGNARDVLSQLVMAYPDAEASRIANERLAELES